VYFFMLLLHAGVFLGLLFNPEDGYDMFFSRHHAIIELNCFMIQKSTIFTAIAVRIITAIYNSRILE
jgi:uncharacterized protein HemY